MPTSLDPASDSAPRMKAFFLDLARIAQKKILPYFRTDHILEDKRSNHTFDPVTQADKEAEQVLRAHILKHFPTHTVLGEEFGSGAQNDKETVTDFHAHLQETSGFVWLIDPIDGTRAFISGLVNWGTLIALYYKGHPVYGLLTQPFIGESFFGNGQNAWYIAPNGAEKTLHVRHRDTPETATLMTTSPFLFSDSEKKAYLQAERAFQMTRYGTDCYGYAMIAMGCADCVIESGLAPYDIGALIPILQGAGGIITDWNGKSAAAGGSVLACGSPKLHERLVNLLTEGCF